MKPVKRASFKCPPNRRLKRIKDTSDGCDTLRARSDRYTTKSGRKAAQTTIRFQQDVDQAQSDSKVMYLSLAENNRLPNPGSSTQAIKGVRKTKALEPSSQDPIQSVKGVEPSHLWSETIPYGHAIGNVQRACGVATENILHCGSGGPPADFDIWGHSIAGHELPVPAAFEFSFDGQLTFDPPYDTLASLESSACTPKEQSNTALEQDVMLSPQITENLYIGSGDNVANTNPQVSKNRSRAIKSQDALKGVGSHSDTGVPCMISALKILLALHIPSPVCLSACDEYAIPSHWRPRLIDFVLATNKKIVQLVSEMLRCSCSWNSQVQLVLTVISGKLMAWYRAAVRNEDDDTEHCSLREQSDITSKMNSSDHTEHVLHQPITIGDYSVVKLTLNNKLPQLLVSNELLKVECLVKSLSRRIQQSSLGRLDGEALAESQSSSAATSGSPTWNEAGQAKVIGGALSAFLHRNMQAANAEVSY